MGVTAGGYGASGAVQPPLRDTRNTLRHRFDERQLFLVEGEAEAGAIVGPDLAIAALEGWGMRCGRSPWLYSISTWPG
jgi:hypothetical protein